MRRARSRIRLEVPVVVALLALLLAPSTSGQQFTDWSAPRNFGPVINTVSNGPAPRNLQEWPEPLHRLRAMRRQEMQLEQVSVPPRALLHPPAGVDAVVV